MYCAGNFSEGESKMSNRVYVSFENDWLDQAVKLGGELMSAGHYPFVPRLSKLIPGRTSDEWVAYYSMWILQCDCLFETMTARPHELKFAREFNIPIVNSVEKVNALKLPVYGELGRQFGLDAARLLEKTEPDENWRKLNNGAVLKSFVTELSWVLFDGLNAPTLDSRVLNAKRKESSLIVGREALKLWDYISRTQGVTS